MTAPNHPIHDKRRDHRRDEDSERSVATAHRVAGANVGLLAEHDALTENALQSDDLRESAQRPAGAWPGLRRWSQAPDPTIARSYRDPVIIRRLYDPNVTPLNINPAVQYAQLNGNAMLTALFNSMQEAAQVVVPPNHVMILAEQQKAVTRAVTAGRAGAAGPDAIAAAAMLLQALQAVPINPVPSVAAVAVAVRALNYAEREVQTGQALALDVRRVKIGTEFSFGDRLPPENPEASVNIKLDMPESPDDEQPDQIRARELAYGQPRTRAQERIQAWVDAAEAGAKDIPGTPTVKVTPHVGKAKTFAKKVTYTFGGNNPWEWYWIADIDEACYETQTKPTSATEFQNNASIKSIVISHIFGGAAAIKLAEEPKPSKKKANVQPQAQPQGLHPDPTSTGGGGHLSFDVGTAFGNNGGAVSLELMLATLQVLQKNADRMAREFRKDTKGKVLREPTEEGGMQNVPLDVANAPSLSTQRAQNHLDDTDKTVEDYTALIKTLTTTVLRGHAADLGSIHTRLQAYNETLTNPEVPDGERKAHVEAPANISHYQAMNIEHLADPEVAKQRIEVRDVPAQTDYVKFLQDLDVLLSSLREARTAVANARSTRLT